MKRQAWFADIKLLIIEVASVISVTMFLVWLLVREYHVMFH